MAKRPKAKLPIRSWFTRYWANNGTLLGGVPRSQSSRWGHEEDAVTSLATTLEINRGAGVDCDGYVVPSTLPPEIFRHCPGSMHQAINGKCQCGKVLTLKDAKLHVAVPLPPPPAEAVDEHSRETSAAKTD